MKEKSKPEKIQGKDLINLSNQMYSLAFEDEFKRTKVKRKVLDEFLNEVSQKDIEDPEEFIQIGIEKTFTPTLISIIKEKLRRFTEKYKNKEKGKVAFLILSLLHGGASLYEIPFFIAIFTRSASRRPLSENRKIMKLLYEFMPKRIKEGETELMEKPDVDKDFEKKFDKHESGLLIPKGQKVKKEKSRIILPGENE